MHFAGAGSKSLDEEGIQGVEAFAYGSDDTVRIGVVSKVDLVGLISFN